MSLIRRIVTNYSLINNILRKQFLNMSAINFNQVEEDLQKNPYYDKYSQKIKKLQEIDPIKYEERISANDERKTTSKEKKENNFEAGQAKVSQEIQTTAKKLTDILKIDLLNDKSSDEITKIWYEYHKTKECVAAVVPGNIYQVIEKRKQKYPTFLLPLPRTNGYEFIVMQWSTNSVHFTPLIAYQTHKENAPECLAIYYFTEFQQTKNIVLMRGEVDRNILKTLEAQLLANSLQLYYGEENEKRTNLLERFTSNPDSFRHMDLIAEIEASAFSTKI